MAIHYDWDEQKRLSNLARHRLDFRDAWRVYEDPNKITVGDPYPNELRLRDFAEVDGTVYFLVYTMREEVVRCISFRLAHRKERRFYYEQLQNRSLYN
jgi:uncharacterized protein